MVKILFEVCLKVGYLQQLGNYYIVRYYKGINPTTSKPKFSYHK